MSIFRRIVDFLTGRQAPAPRAPVAAPETGPPAAQDPYFAPEPTETSGKSKGPKPHGSLDGDAYLPISRDEIAEAGKGGQLLGNLWAFGRRDIIPPSDDPRTKVIDRAMVTHGLLSPEQLVEIHAVGATMDEVRPSAARIANLAAQSGEAAVQASREEKTLIKAAKKAAAAERKWLYAEGVARRKATDITFLGRGVSGRLNDRDSRPDLLEAAGLPLMRTPADVAAALELTIPRLRWLAFHAEVASRIHYVQFEVSKRSGGTRTLSAPHASLAKAQQWIFENIVAKLPVHDSTHGFVASRSIVTNAAPHAGRAVVVNLDLKGFFPSIGFPRVRSVFVRYGYSPAVATILALLCTECPRRTVLFDGKAYHVATGPRGLPQGACTSPGLSNQVARRLDRRLGGLAAKIDLTYTRYADDLTFSSDDNTRVGYLLTRVRHLATAEGFTVNESKTRVLRRNTAQVVTGLVVNDQPSVSRAEIRRIRAILHRAKTEGLDAQNREGREHFRAWLQGKIAFITMVRPEVGASLRVVYEALANRA